MHDIHSTLRNEIPTLEKLAPDGFPVAITIENCLERITREPELAKCTSVSLLLAIREAILQGFDPSGYTGDGTLVPRRRQNGPPRAIFIPDYRAILRQLMQLPRVAHVESHVVHEGDHFELRYGDGPGPIVLHRPTLSGKRGDPIGAYSIVFFTAGKPLVEYMTKEEIDSAARRGGSYDADISPWRTDWCEMARKTVVKRLAKYLPPPRRYDPASPVPTDVATAHRASQPVTAADDDNDEGDPPTPAERGDVTRYFDMIQRATNSDIPALAAAIKGDDALDTVERSELFRALNARRKALAADKHPRKG